MVVTVTMVRRLKFNSVNTRKIDEEKKLNVPDLYTETDGPAG